MKKSLIRRHGWRRLSRAFAEVKEAGMTTAEYAVGTIAACAFAALLLAIAQSGGIKSLVTKVIEVGLSVSL